MSVHLPILKNLLLNPRRTFVVDDKDVLGLEMQDWGGAFITPEAMAAHPGAGTVFSPFKADTDYMLPSTKEFMINLAVDMMYTLLDPRIRY